MVHRIDRESFARYNPATFEKLSSSGFGNCGLGAFRGPGLVNGDGGLEKKFAFRERYNFAFRMKGNVGNTPHHASPGYGPSTGTTTNNNVQNSTFMQIQPLRTPVMVLISELSAQWPDDFRAAGSLKRRCGSLRRLFL